MTDREKYRTRSGYYLATRNQAKAIEELSALVNQFPADTAGHANLALAYFYSRDMNKALEEQKRALGHYSAQHSAAQQFFHVRVVCRRFRNRGEGSQSGARGKSQF